MPSRGGEITVLTDSCDRAGTEGITDFRAPSAGPDGRRIIALQFTPDEHGIVSMDPDGSDRQVVPLSPDTIYNSRPSFAPDGERFTFEDGIGAIWERRFDSDKARLIKAPIDCGAKFPQDNAGFMRPAGLLMAVSSQ